MHKLNVEQGSLEWHDERFGSVTGTRLQSAIGAKWDARKSCWKLGDEKVQNTLMYELLSERMSQNEVVELNTSAVIRGKELEPFAIKAASNEREIEFTECGMLICDWVGNLKFSPDAIHEVGGVIVGGLETKCPNGKKHVEYLLNDEVPREYFWQVIGPMILSDSVKWWDFASYDDRNYERGLFIIRTYRCDVEDLINESRKVLLKFLGKVDEVHMGLTF